MRMKITTLFLTLLFLVSASFGGESRPAQGAKQPSIDEVIRRFTVAESENKVMRNNYAFTQDFSIMTLSDAGIITGRYQRVSDIVLDDRGNRIEKITYFPMSTLRDLSISREDMHDLANVQPFGLTPEDLPKYVVTYLGKEKIDELNTYVFDVKPKKLVKGERYLEGKIWVDDEDLQIVKVAGQAVPEDSQNQYPKFESYRENVDGKYWFPTYVYADDVLEFKNNSVRMRMVVKFTNYKKFTTGIRIADDEGEAAGDEKEGEKPNEKSGEKKPDDKSKKPEEQKSTDKKKPEPPPVKKKPDGN